MTELLVIRHAIAFDRDPSRWRDDTQRPLSPQGIRKARKAAAGLKRLTRPPNHLLTSPLLRARQTAMLLTDCAGWPGAQAAPELAPGVEPRVVLDLLGQYRTGRIALVGHQPGLSQLLTACLAGEVDTFDIEMKKNAVACLSFRGAPRAGRATLNWLATPRLLRSVR